MTDCWLKRLWCVMSTLKISFQMPQLEEDLLSSRDNDSFFMDAAVCCDFTSAQLQSLNRCRLFLQILWISDVLTGEGKRIRRAVWDGKREIHYGWDYNWPNQGAPPRSDWQTWRACLGTIFDVPSRDREIKVCYWVGGGARSRDMQWFYQEEEDRIYRARGDVFLIFSALPTLRRTKLYHITSITNTLPSEVMAATVDLTTTVTRVRLTGTWYLEPTPPARSRLDTPLQSYLTSLPKEERWPFTDCIIPDDDGRELATAIQEGKLWICADGSYKEQAQLGTTAFQLVSRISDSRWIGRFRTPGIRKFQSAYRSEAAGLCAGLHAVAIIVKKYSITAGIIRIGCDSDSALKNTFKEAPPLPTFPQYDLLRISRYWMEQLQGVQCIPTFVQGHADDLGSPLTFMEQLNVECDALAKAKLHSLLSHPIPPYDPPLAHSGPCLLMDGWRISSNVSTELYEFIHAEATMTYWEQKRDDFPPAVHWMVDWDAAEQAVNSLSTAKRIWLAKHVTEYCAVGIVMKLRGARIHSECPRCGIPDETVTHVLKCKE